MRLVAGLMAILPVAGAWGAEPAKPRPAWMEREWRLGELEERALTAYPRRRDTPLRDLNMTDEEVREVQVIARKYEMPELVNISPVVTGCPCEEGGSCTEQVYITSRVGERTVGMQLSRKKNLWTVGVVQKWWLEYAALKSREPTMPYREFRAAKENLLLRWPACARPTDAASPPTSIAEIKATK